MEQLIDARGLACPQPVLRAKKEMESGTGEFTVLVDNRAAKENLTRLAQGSGFSVDITEDAGGIYRIAFHQGGGMKEAAPAVQEKGTAGNQGGWVSLVARATMGDGDPTLGATLMKMYFFTLSESEDPPAAILFMNGGVRLPVQEEQIISHLRVLEGRGTRILVCGTCLDYYGLTARLQIGTVSNMYEITQCMGKASKVVTL